MSARVFTPRRFLLVGCLAALLACGCVTAFTTCMKVSIHKGKPFPIAQSVAGHGWGFVSHPDLSRYSDSSLFLNFTVAGDGGGRATPEDVAGLAPALSLDGGDTWILGMNSVSSVAPDVAFANAYTLVDGKRTMRYGGAPLLSGSFPLAWFEDGRLVDGPREVPCELPPSKAGFYFNPNGVVLPNGHLMLPASGVLGSDPKSRVITVVSTNKGDDWSYFSTVAESRHAPWGSEGPCEPALMLLPSGELLCVMRTGMAQYDETGVNFSHKMLLARSKDGGVTWTHERMHIPGVMPKLLRMSNGLLVLAFGRPGNNLIFSADEGRSWGREVALSPADVKTSGYVGVVEVDTNRLFAVYDVFNMDTRGIWLWEPKTVNGVFGVFLDVRRRGP